MSKLDELMQKYCPAGPEHKKIGDVVKYEQPSKYIVKSTDYKDDFETPVLTAGQTFILGYTNETEGIYIASKENPVIIFDDFTGAFKWVDFPFKVKSSAMKMLTTNTKDTLLRYIYHVMRNLNFTSDEHKRLWISVYSEFQIPVPPLPVQEEIVRILDKFTELEAELAQELARRKLQYTFYRDQLLNFESKTTMQWLNLENCCKILDNKRKPVSKSERENGIYPYYGANGIQDYVSDYIFDGDFVLVGEDGSVITKDGNPVVNWVSGKIWVNNHAHIIEASDGVLLRYLFHYLQTVNVTHLIHGNIPKLTGKDFKEIKIPVPSIDVQQRLINVLDNFDAICSDLSIGLPAEISARQKQYEYYRDVLFEYAANGLNYSRAQQSTAELTK